MSTSLQPRGLQHARLACLSLSPRICSDSCPSFRWCYPAMSLPVTPFSSCPQTFPASESFPMSWLFASDGQSFGASTSSSALPMNISGLIFLRIDWLDVLAIQRTLKEYSPVPQFKSINSLQLSPPFGPALTLIHNYWKNHSFDCMDLCSPQWCLLLNILSRCVIAFLPSSKSLNFMAAVMVHSDFGAQENKMCHCS